jgi:hypothetical protein
MVFLEENDPRGSNAGLWVVYPSPSQAWIDWPASWHLGANVHSFADGHNVCYRMRDTRTVALTSFYASTPGNPDLEYFQSIYNPR